MEKPVLDEDEVLVVEDIEEIIDLGISNPNVWRVLVVDDDADMHHVTRLVLSDFKFQNRSLELISAYSGKEAYDILAKPNDIALVLLDVVMETEDAGLVLTRQIREQLKNQLVRIVLRTGQSGKAPETEVVAAYDINDYKDKSELTVQKLRTTVISSLRAYSNLLEMHQNLKQRESHDQVQSEYVSTVNHELRTPLTSIHGALGLLASETLVALPPTARNLVKVALRNSERLSNLLSDIIDVEKIASGTLSLDLQRVDLVGLTKICLSDNEIFATQKQIRYVLADPVVPIWVMVDANRVQQIFANLLSNAVRFSPQASEIQIRLIEQTDQVRVEIQDFGTGIPEAYHPNIFHRFAQTSAGDSRPQKGTGLGLSICKALVQLMDGQIGFESVEHQGSTFWFTLPIFGKIDD